MAVGSKFLVVGKHSHPLYYEVIKSLVVLKFGLHCLCYQLGQDRYSIKMLTTFTTNMLIACKSGGAIAPWPTLFLRPCSVGIGQYGLVCKIGDISIERLHIPQCMYRPRIQGGGFVGSSSLPPMA